MPTSTDSGSGPVDGEEIRMDIAPHHRKHSRRETRTQLSALLTGAVVVDVVLYYVRAFLWQKGGK